MPPRRHPGARYAGLLATPENTSAHLSPQGVWVPGEGECSRPYPPSCPSSPWQPWGSQKLLKPWKCSGPGARELAGAPRRGRKSPGCLGIEWIQHTHSPPHTPPPLLCRHHWSLDQNSAPPNICHPSLRCKPAHLLQVFPGQRQGDSGKKTSFLGSSATVVAALASGSLGHGVGGRAGRPNSGNCLLSTWALCTGVASRAAPGHGGKGCGLLNDRAGALLLLSAKNCGTP